ncbi:MAG: PmoA family protein [Planctomycetaceae bacterium]|jgi:hypothetical protein|nr:PmoA family protein [Planctomycetaceae bacterium]
MKISHKICFLFSATVILAYSFSTALCEDLKKSESSNSEDAKLSDIAVVLPVKTFDLMKNSGAIELKTGKQLFHGSFFSTPSADGTADKDKMVVIVENSQDNQEASLKSKFAELSKEFVVMHTPSDVTPSFQFKELGNNTIALYDKDKPVYHYVYDLVTNENVPKKEVRRRTRGCYMHPMFGLNGEELTDDFPKDHYHHHGLFWAWPHVQIGNEHHDFWNETTDLEQRFVKWLVKETGEYGATLAVENGWFVGERKVAIERVWFRSFAAHDGSRSLDVQIFVIPIGQPITLRGAEGKSYGGLVIRLKPELQPPGNDMNKTICKITVPSGVAKDDLPETPLEWVDMVSKFGGRETISGAAVFVPPSHPDFPPTWLVRHYGPLCVGWPGVKNRTFEADQSFSIGYRVWIHEKDFNRDQLVGIYDAYKKTLEIQNEYQESKK